MSYDIAIVGAGMAGASLGAALAAHARVIVLEAEDRPGYHATGRSAAFWTESYGGPGVQPLTTASGRFLREGDFLAERGALTIARAGCEARLTAFAETYRVLGVRIEELDRAALLRHIPGLLPEWTTGAFEPDCADIDVARLHQHYLSVLRQAGGEVRCNAGLVGTERKGKRWALRLADGAVIDAGLVVNAAGAWADEVARRACVRPVGIRPYRRTVAQVRTAPPAPAALPLVLDLDEKFYFKPEAGRLWLSPHDETPSAALDAAPEEFDVALAIDRLEQVTDWEIQAVERKWAGLRSFAPDRLPVYGFAPDEPAFFWFAGQGGFGIQTAPAAADLAARLILGQTPGTVDPAPYSPARFA